MKTLSVQQPWASLICSGIKDVENRTWKTNYRGRILIHASNSKVSQEFSNSIYDAGDDQYKWKLENAYMFDEPITGVKGKLHLFEYEMDENNLPPYHEVQLRVPEVTPSES